MLPTALLFVGFVAVVNGAAIQLGDGVGGSAIVVSANGSDLILTLKGANANHIVPLDVTEKTETPSTAAPTTVTSTEKPTTERSNDTKQKTTTEGSSEESSESSETSVSSTKAATEPVTTPKPDSAVGNAPTFGLIALLVVSVRFF